MDFWDLKTATAAFAYVMAVGFLALFGAVVYKIYIDKIDLGTLIQEKDGSGKSSISRFQLLVFTLVIAGLYVILSIENGQLIDVPNGALLLLGISAGSFVVSKGISRPPSPPTPQVVVQAPSPVPPPGPQVTVVQGGGPQQ
jgi:hypothetical protein